MYWFSISKCHSKISKHVRVGNKAIGFSSDDAIGMRKSIKNFQSKIIH